MVRVTENNNRIIVEELEDGWVKVCHKDGMLLLLKSFKDKSEGSVRTICVSNDMFSYGIISIHDYDLNDLVLEDGIWEAYSNKIVGIEIYDRYGISEFNSLHKYVDKEIAGQAKCVYEKFLW